MFNYKKYFNIIKKIKDKLYKIKKNFKYEIIKLINKKKINENLLKDLEKKLISLDIGVNTTKNIINNLNKKLKKNKINNYNVLYKYLLQELKKILYLDKKKNIEINKKKPFVILIIGVNGVGKTTVISKLAYRFKKIKKKSVMLAAGDTFRSAGIEQLKIWGKKINVPVISQKIGSDSASVMFDSIKSAQSKNIDILILDTSGRLQNKKNLMKELKKIVKVIKKIDIYYPNEIILVIDATNGQNSIEQVKLFNKFVKITGIILTKLDCTSKGGTIFSIYDKFKIPIKYISYGENIKDLNKFIPDKFIKNIIN